LWITKELKICVNEKKTAFLKGDNELLREKRKELRSQIKKAKLDFKNKVESRLNMGNAKQAWDGLNTMMGRETRKPMYHSQGVFFAENLNVFFSRFDRGTCTTECDRICRDIPTYENIILKEHETAASLACIKPNKAPGPDGLKGRVLKDCAFQLTGVLTKLFQLLLNEKVVPSSWKLSNIIPVPKISNANQSKDFRPIALTSILGKCMERVLSTYIKNDVNKYLDPLQFAYKTARGTDDATLTLCNLVSEHIQQTSNMLEFYL